LGSQNNTPDETGGINIAVSCYREAVQLGRLKMQDLDNDGPIRRAGKCKNWKMTDQFAGLENARTGK